MGSRGFTLEKAPPKWDTAGYIGGVKVLERKDKRQRAALPPFSNTPGTAYVLLNDDGTFSQLRVFDEKRNPRCDIDYGIHHSTVEYLHFHRWRNGERDNVARTLSPGHPLYGKFKRQIEWGAHRDEAGP